MHWADVAQAPGRRYSRGMETRGAERGERRGTWEFLGMGSEGERG